MRTGKEVRKELERAKNIKAHKRTIGETGNITLATLAVTAKKHDVAGPFGKGVLMFSDYNYGPYNSQLLPDFEDDAEGKRHGEHNSELKSESLPQPEDTGDGLPLLRQVTLKSYTQADVTQLLAAQQQDDLGELVPLKIAIQAEASPTTV